ncbi:MAG: hypothetical protein R3F43_11625 [bacterium]
MGAAGRGLHPPGPRRGACAAGARAITYRRHRDRYLATLLSLRTHPDGRVRRELFDRLLDPLWRAGREAQIAPKPGRCWWIGQRAGVERGRAGAGRGGGGRGGVAGGRRGQPR